MLIKLPLNVEVTDADWTEAAAEVDRIKDWVAKKGERPGEAIDPDQADPDPAGQLAKVVVARRLGLPRNRTLDLYKTIPDIGDRFRVRFSYYLSGHLFFRPSEMSCEWPWILVVAKDPDLSALKIVGWGTPKMAQELGFRETFGHPDLPVSLALNQAHLVREIEV